MHILISISYVIVFIKVKLCQNSLLWREFSSAFIVSSSCAASFTSSSCSLASNSLIYWRKLEAPMLLLLTKTEVSRLLPSIYPHCAFSSNLFHRQITQKFRFGLVNQLCGSRKQLLQASGIITQQECLVFPTLS